ncbi:MAG: transposase [Treponema sp.]|nr:transposase [Treponema sp.]
MTERDAFNLAEEFAKVDFNEKRLEKRFRKTMETLSKDPQKSIYGSSANRAEAKAIYISTTCWATISLTRAKYCRLIAPRPSGI